MRSAFSDKVTGPGLDIFAQTGHKGFAIKAGFNGR